MAFIYKRGDVWYIAYQTRAGLKRKSTGMKNELDAQNYLNHFAPKKKNQTFDIRLSEYENEFIENISIDHAIGTVKLYRLTFKYIYEIIGNNYIDDYVIQDFNKLKNALTKRMKIDTVNIHVRNTKCIFKNAYELDYSRECRTHKLKQFKIPKRKFLAFTETELNNIISNFSPGVYKDIVLFGIQTGCRLNEILCLRYKDVDFKKGYIYIKDVKTNDYRDLPLTDEVSKLISKRLSENNIIDFDYKDKIIFCNKAGNVFDKSKISKIFKSVLRELQFDERYHFHCLRHTFASDLANNGVPINQIAYLMGHKNYETTKKYIHTGYNELKKSMEVRSIKSI